MPTLKGPAQGTCFPLGRAEGRCHAGLPSRLPPGPGAAGATGEYSTETQSRPVARGRRLAAPAAMTAVVSLPGRAGPWGGPGVVQPLGDPWLQDSTKHN